jgi:hypothetical protein
MHRSLWLLLAICVSGLVSACGGGSGNITGVGGGGVGGQLAATHFSVTTPQDANVGTALSFTVTALDASNLVATGYTGTMYFTSTDSQAVLPATSTLTNGSGLFSATLESAGSQTITATDKLTPTITGVSNAIQVSAAARADTFTPTGSMAFPRAGHTATLLNDGSGRVLVGGGGNTSAELFDPRVSTCSRACRLRLFSPTARFSSRAAGLPRVICSTRQRPRSRQRQTEAPWQVVSALLCSRTARCSSPEAESSNQTPLATTASRLSPSPLQSCSTAAARPSLTLAI